LKRPIYINRDWHDYASFYHPNPRFFQTAPENTGNPCCPTAGGITQHKKDTAQTSARPNICGVARSLAIRRWMFEDT
jgi:hypothetical protein